MTEVNRRYRALLEISNVLNSQREMDCLWRRVPSVSKRSFRGNEPDGGLDGGLTARWSGQPTGH